MGLVKEGSVSIVILLSDRNGDFMHFPNKKKVKNPSPMVKSLRQTKRKVSKKKYNHDGRRKSNDHIKANHTVDAKKSCTS